MMNVSNVSIETKGGVIGVENVRSIVWAWGSSPTGDSSDSHIFTIPCRDASHAQSIADRWRMVWGL